ncbi:MAG: hypothetical protein COV45_03425 [Deltaproteobacteria bacterium CG11_big_fil_rev_8_21_14_0_20_47_16]|nr:MAG: hypothetical protein COV45_03425 [Deltaproteobacteria bacterium CG11_big_fil_rev_8_21_14_0_20_47_16]
MNISHKHGIGFGNECDLVCPSGTRIDAKSCECKPNEDWPTFPIKFEEKYENSRLMSGLWKYSASDGGVVIGKASVGEGGSTAGGGGIVIGAQMLAVATEPKEPAPKESPEPKETKEGNDNRGVGNGNKVEINIFPKGCAPAR